MRLVRGAVCAVAGVIVVFSVQAAAWSFSVKYDQTISGQVPAMRSTVVLKDKKFRMESVVEGMQAVTIRNETGLYSYFPAQNMGMRLPDLDASQGFADEAADYNGFLMSNNATLVGAENVRGYACDIFEFNDPDEGGKGKAWVWKERQFPIKVEMQTENGLMVVDVENIQFNPAVSDNDFELPVGISMVDMGGAMGMFGSMMQQAGASVNRSGSGANANAFQQQMQQLINGIDQQQ